MDFIKMIMELPGEKRSQDVVEHTEWNSLWKLIVTQGNHSENYLEQLYDYFFNKTEGWVQKVQAELDGVQPYIEGVMTQPVGKAPDGSLWTYPSTESGTVPWGNVMGDITRQQDLIQKFETKADAGHRHDINTLTFNEGDIDSSWISYSPQSVPASALTDLSVTTEKLNNGAVTSAKIASGAVINDSIANGVVSRAKLAQNALYSPIRIVLSGAYNITTDNLGETFRCSQDGDTTLVLTAENSAAFPSGAEIAVLRYRPENSYNTLISFGDFSVVCQGWPAARKNVTIKISDGYGMIALKKITSAGTWFVTGNVEVVS